MLSCVVVLWLWNQFSITCIFFCDPSCYSVRAITVGFGTLCPSCSCNYDYYCQQCWTPKCFHFLIHSQVRVFISPYKLHFLLETKLHYNFQSVISDYLPNHVGSFTPFAHAQVNGNTYLWEKLAWHLELASPLASTLVASCLPVHS